MKKMLNKMTGLSIVLAMVFTLFMPVMVSALSVSIDLNGGKYNGGDGTVDSMGSPFTLGSDNKLTVSDYQRIIAATSYFQIDGGKFKGFALDKDGHTLFKTNDELKDYVFANTALTLYLIWEMDNAGADSGAGSGAGSGADSGAGSGAGSGASSGTSTTLANPKGSPKTGDVGVAIYVGFMVVSALGVIMVVKFLKKVR